MQSKHLIFTLYCEAHPSDQRMTSDTWVCVFTSFRANSRWGAGQQCDLGLCCHWAAYAWQHPSRSGPQTCKSRRLGELNLLLSIIGLLYLPNSIACFWREIKMELSNEYWDDKHKQSMQSKRISICYCYKLTFWESVSAEGVLILLLMCHKQVLEKMCLSWSRGEVVL